MPFILKLLVSSLAVFFASSLMSGVSISGFPMSIVVALLIGFLNVFLRPLLILLTIPFTLLTFGLFLLIINASIVYLADYLLEGFTVNGFGTAIVFSIIVTAITWILEAIAKPKVSRKVNNPK